ncbi:MAG: AMP-binding protein [Cellulomonadaceae bacterium]
MTTTLADRPWLDSYAPGVHADIPVPDEPLTAPLERNARLFGDRVALDFMGRSTSYRKLALQVSVAAGALRHLGVRRGDRVAIALPNCPAHVVAFYAVLRLGAVVVEHNPTYSASELGHQLSDSGATVAICWEQTAARVAEVQDATTVHTLISVNLSRDLPGIKRFLLNLPVAKARTLKAAMRGKAPRHAIDWHKLLRSAAPLPADHPEPDVSDLALLQYTGGTTGTPKGAMLTHANLAANARQGQEWTQLGFPAEDGTPAPAEVVYGVLPFFHAFGLTLCLSFSLRIGATLVLLPKFDVPSVLAAQKRRPGTFLPAVPPMLERLTKGARADETADLSSFRFAICGAMPLSAEVAAGWEEVTGGLAIEGYGMTETSPVALGNPLTAQRQPGTLGLPFPSTYIRIADQEDPTREVAPGERGELQISGPQVFPGYWQRPEESANVLFEADGRTWVRTGDVVVMQPDGFVRLVDRIKEMIITGGFKVYPSQVEDHLREMPGVQDVAVIGVPGGDLGEKVVAAIVLATDAHPVPVDLDTVRAWCNERLARYAVPKQLEIVKELPRSQIGKVLRRVVREGVLAGPHGQAQEEKADGGAAHEPTSDTARHDAT